MKRQLRRVGSALPALLALTLVGGSALAGGTLFDADYKVCPRQTRLQSGGIADLTLSRDAGEEDEVHAAWTVANPGNRRLAANACRVSLVAILDDNDGDPVVKALSLGTRKAAFDQVKAGTGVHGPAGRRDGNRRRRPADQRRPGTDDQPEPDRTRLATVWKRVTATADADAAGFQYATEAVAGTMYCIGHNENFGNHRSTDPDFVTAPATPRLRIGLAHSANETDDQRDDVDFQACRIRITDGNGDAPAEADDVATVAGNYGARDWDHDGNDDTPALKVPHKLFLYDLLQAPTFNPGPTPAKGTLGTGGHALVNVRVNDGGGITVPMHAGGALANRDGAGTRPPPPGHGDGRHVRHWARLHPCRDHGRRVRETARRAPGRGRRGRRAGGRAEGAAGRHRPRRGHRLH